MVASLVPKRKDHSRPSSKDADGKEWINWGKTPLNIQHSIGDKHLNFPVREALIEPLFL